MVLPDPKNSWAHSTCSKESLRDALDDPKICAIEADIVMGKLSGGNNDDYLPIMAHPPCVMSDISTENFLTMAIIDQIKSKCPLKHLKLDFKDFETISPVLKCLDRILNKSNYDEDKVIFLNADILPGPGGRYGPLKIESEQFLEGCVSFLNEGEYNKRSCAFSLGWRVDCRSLYGYTQTDVDDMKKLIIGKKLLECSRGVCIKLLIQRTDIVHPHTNEFHIDAFSNINYNKRPGVVLAVNARVLNKNLFSFDSLLKEIPQIQLLVWTGTGEPPISIHQIRSIESHFKSIGCGHQLGFDCQVRASIRDLFQILTMIRMISLTIFVHLDIIDCTIFSVGYVF